MSELPKFSSGSPRPGQWCKFRMKDKDRFEKLKSLGAWTTADGCLVGVFAAPTQTTMVKIVRGKDGKEEKTGGDWLPGRIMVVDADGDDLYGLYKDDKTRASVSRPVFFQLSDKDITDVHPMTDFKDFPPKRQRHEDAVLLP
jgi:hypothetical protein